MELSSSLTPASWGAEYFETFLETAFTWGEDENKERGNWTGKADFLLSTIGCAAGLGTVWRFPYKAYENGGATFWIIYLVFMLTLGLPVYFLEVSLGQFSSRGPITVWNCMPIFKGLGWGMAVTSLLSAIYYNMLIAYAFYYLFASFTSRVPWQDCRDEWMRINISGKLTSCISRTSNFSAIQQQSAEYCNGSELVGDTDDEDYLFNCTATKKTPALLYWERVVLDQSEGMDDGQYVIQWELVLCLLLAWIIVFLCICKGIKFSGKVVYITAVLPYVVLIILCIRNALLEGSMKGIELFVNPDFEKLKTAKPWYEASVQMFFSLGVGFGGIGTMGSYNRFNNNVYRDAISVCIMNCVVSVFAGFAVFSVIGYMAVISGEDINKVVSSGPGLVFVAFPEGMATMPVTPLWSILFFLMIIMLGLDTQIVAVESLIAAINDEFHITKSIKHGDIMMTTVLIVLMFLAGLPQCTRAGVYVVELFSWYCTGYSVILIAFLQMVAVAWCYDYHRFKEDIQMMVGKGSWINASFYYYWFPCWIIISPALMMYIFVNMAVEFTPIMYAGEIPYPDWADGLGFLMVALPLVFLPVIALVEYCKAHNFPETMRKVVHPGPTWGPALDKFRTGRYQPLGETEVTPGSIPSMEYQTQNWAYLEEESYSKL